MSRIRLFSVLSFALVFGSSGNAHAQVSIGAAAKATTKPAVDNKTTGQNLNKAVDDYKISLQKVAGNNDQIASADTMKATNNSSRVVMIPGKITNANWSTGNGVIDGYIRQYSGVYGVDPYLVY